MLLSVLNALFLRMSFSMLMVDDMPPASLAQRRFTLQAAVGIHAVSKIFTSVAFCI